MYEDVNTWVLLGSLLLLILIERLQCLLSTWLNTGFLRDKQLFVLTNIGSNCEFSKFENNLVIQKLSTEKSYMQIMPIHNIQSAKKRPPSSCLLQQNLRSKQQKFSYNLLGKMHCSKSTCTNIADILLLLSRIKILLINIFWTFCFRIWGKD